MAVQRDRLLDAAIKLIEVSSPTRSAADVADLSHQILGGDGFYVERPEAVWSAAPAVVARYATGKPGRTLQFNGHLDTVHLPFVPPRVEDGILYGSGCSDMKGGLAAAFEALRVLRETDLLPGGARLLTAHDLHEAYLLPPHSRRLVLSDLGVSSSHKSSEAAAAGSPLASANGIW